MLPGRHGKREENAPQPTCSRKGTHKLGKMNSKYDFVKVRVWLSGSLTHYYVLSRYLISRMLTVTTIPYVKAVKIALELKKHLVDKQLLDLPQDHMESCLFMIMASKGYGPRFIQRYKMINQFFQQRRPVLILICGAPCTGKSTLSQQLAARLNLPNVLQTDLVYELLRTSAESPVHNTPLWQRSDLSDVEAVNEYQRECCVVRKGVAGEINKVLAEGKSMIFEGMHLDPSLYISDFTAQGIPIARSPSFYPGKIKMVGLGATPSERHPPPNPFTETLPQHLPGNTNNCVDVSGYGVESEPLPETPFASCGPPPPSDGASEKKTQSVVQRRDSTTELQPLFIPIIVSMDKADHQVVVHQWSLDVCKENGLRFDDVFRRVRGMDKYMRETSCEGVTVVKADLAGFSQALDSLHDHFLDCVEVAMMQP
ncbi:hypothetical protein BSKO_05840 [Bryopsis sp. KO-2023]|nr:hypothetical protein BSKO_05840 [Bryopsis sp. KO-2023]